MIWSDPELVDTLAKKAVAAAGVLSEAVSEFFVVVAAAAVAVVILAVMTTEPADTLTETFATGTDRFAAKTAAILFFTVSV